MGRFKNGVFFYIYELFLFLCMTSPEEEYEEFSFFGECLDNSICESLPSFSDVRHRLSCSDCECGIQEKNSLACPASEISIVWQRSSNIIMNLFKDINEWRRVFDSFLNRKRESMSLSRAMIRILSKNNHFYRFKWGTIKSCKNILWMRINNLSFWYFISYKIRKLRKIGFLKFIFENSFPTFMQNNLSHTIFYFIDYGGIRL